jgi:hypothetical protein
MHSFLYTYLETVRIMWWGMAGGRADVHIGFRTITLVLYIGSLPNLVTWFPVEGEEPYLFWGH